jgi:hypothetical protein
LHDGLEGYTIKFNIKYAQAATPEAETMRENIKIQTWRDDA